MEMTITVPNKDDIYYRGNLFAGNYIVEQCKIVNVSEVYLEHGKKGLAIKEIIVLVDIENHTHPIEVFYKNLYKTKALATKAINKLKKERK